MREISRMSKTLATLRKWSVFSALTTPQQWLLSSEVRDRQWVPNRICHQPQGGSETAPQRPHRLQQSASLSLHQFFSQFVQMSNLLTTWRHASLSLITNILVSHGLQYPSISSLAPSCAQIRCTWRSSGCLNLRRNFAGWPNIPDLGLKIGHPEILWIIMDHPFFQHVFFCGIIRSRLWT